MTRDDIAAVIRLIPTLTTEGIGLPLRDPVERSYAKELAAKQAELLDSVDDCNAVLGWLATKKSNKRLRRFVDAYWLKHVFEREPAGM